MAHAVSANSSGRLCLCIVGGCLSHMHARRQMLAAAHYPGATAALLHAAANCSVALSPPEQPQAAVCYGTTTLAATYAFEAASMQSAQFIASVDGTSCTPPAGEDAGAATLQAITPCMCGWW